MWRERRKVIGAGVAAGVVGLAISFAGRGIIPGRVLGDPMPMILSVGQLLRGPLYWNWRAPLVHLLFLVLLAALTLASVWMLGDRWQDFPQQVVWSARATAALNVGVVALLEIDALIVAVYYLLGCVVSVYLTGWMAGSVAARVRPGG